VTPTKPHGTFIHAGEQVYWLNYDERRDLQRLTQPGNGSRSTENLGGYSVSLDDDAAQPLNNPPSSQHEEPLLPETPAPELTRVMRSEMVAPNMLAQMASNESLLRHPSRHNSIPLRAHITRQGSSRSDLNAAAPNIVPHARNMALQAVLPAEANPHLVQAACVNLEELEGTVTPRRTASTVTLAIHGSVSTCNGATTSSASSLRAPTGATTPRRSLPQQLVRRHLSAPRLGGVAAVGRDPITPRANSPGTDTSRAAMLSARPQRQRSQLNQVYGPSVSQLAPPIGAAIPRSAMAPLLTTPMLLPSPSPRPDSSVLPVRQASVSQSSLPQQRLGPNRDF